MIEQVPGIPKGYRLVRIGKPLKDELFITTLGGVSSANWDFGSVAVPIVEKIEPNCTWQKGVFANGWIAKDQDGHIWWYDNKPVVKQDTYYWQNNDRGYSDLLSNMLLNPPLFKAGLPWAECLQQVGPEVENG